MFNLGDKLSKKSAKLLSPITLAFIGDAVYTLFVREKLVFESDRAGGELNKRTSAVVKATAQAEYVRKIMPYLTEEEVEIFKRARNAKKGTRAKSASVSEYNASTGFEALVGYLYVTGEIDRINYLLSLGENDENLG
ncbi:MAG: ribonuclease III [Clostridia bacterium]|jgi:ribonuclease-3 family protein|nr:ribonuclease III [Clostridia bacterium]